jgi:hypothetical protein
MTTSLKAPTQPGVYDIPADVYHADKNSLSNSGAKLLLPPSCPAKFRYEQDHGRPPKKEFDFGQAAHQMVLGVGPGIVVVNKTDWRSKSAQAERDAAYLDGAIPLLARDYKRVVAMAKALREHPVARLLFAEGSGLPEQSLYWVDRPTGVLRRARPDWLPHHGGGRLIIPDYKSAQDASTAAAEKAMFEFGYFRQAPWYEDGARALGADDVAFVLVFQEKAPPYLVNVVEPAAIAKRIGRELNRRALEKFAECTAAGVWPGYGDDIKSASLPPWAENKLMQELV